jgi:integrase
MGKLTDVSIRVIKAAGTVQRFADGGGLYIFVPPTGAKLWRVDYRFDGKKKLLSLGAYPVLTLAGAREKLLEVKRQLKAGIDPAAVKKASKEAVRVETENSFEMVAREWFNKFSAVWTPSNRERVLRRLVKSVFPLIGAKPINEVKAGELLAALQVIEKRGALETAKRTLQDCGRIFRYGVATGRCEYDIAAALRGALPPAKGGHLAAITEPRELGALLRAIDTYSLSSIIVGTALRLTPYLFVRPGELRKAEWVEFTLEGSDPLWVIPAERMKMKEKHFVPLAPQVLAMLHDLRQYSGHTKYLFPSPRTDKRPISDMTLTAGLQRLGYTGDIHTVHGFRATASTILNEQGYNRDWIERQLAHGERNSIRAAYNHAEYMPERRKMMTEWADYLDSLRGTV